MDLGQASKIARLTQLAPAIIEGALAGTHHAPTLERLIRRALPADWDAQRRRLGISA